MPKTEIETDINDFFNVTKPRHTLKTKLKRNTLTASEFKDMMLKAFQYINNGNPQNYTAMEFQYGDCYFVIAKLKDNR